MSHNAPNPSVLRRIGKWSQRLVPSVIVNLYLMIKWRCLIHPFAVIKHPSACRIGRGARIGRCTIICNGRRPYSIVLGRCYVHDGAIVDALGGWIEIGDRTTINPYCVLYGAGGLSIGANCGIATQSVVVAAQHTFELTGIPMMDQPVIADGIIIEDDVWLGAGSKILDGVRVSSGCVIAAGAIVTKDCPPGAVMAGVPARRLKTRNGF